MSRQLIVLPGSYDATSGSDYAPPTTTAVGTTKNAIDVYIQNPEAETNPLVAKITASVGSLSSVGVGTVSTPILSANASRRSFMVSNPGSKSLLLAYSGTASISLFTFEVLPGDVYIHNIPVQYTGVVSAIRSSGSAAVFVTEFLP